MKFQIMIAKLKADGLLDEDNKLTQKGHEYVDNVKERYKERIVPFNPKDEAEVEQFRGHNRAHRKSVFWSMEWS